MDPGFRKGRIRVSMSCSIDCQPATISEAEAVDGKFPGVFTSDAYKKRKKASVKVPQRQAEIEEKWDSFTKKNYAAAEAKANEALAMLK